MRIQEPEISETVCSSAASLCVALTFHQRLPSLRGPAWRLPRLRPENLAACPWRVARDRRETPLVADRAADAIEQKICVTLPLLERAADLAVGPASTTAAARAGLRCAVGA